MKNKDVPIDFRNVTVIAGSVDGETQGTQTLSVRDDGVFSFETMATSVGVLAMTKDGSAAGVIIVKNPRRLLRIQLQPTKQFRGRLLDQDNQPIAGRNVEAHIRVDDRDGDHFNRSPFFEAKMVKVKTDAQGYYNFKKMPCDVQLALHAESATKQQDHWLGIVELKANEETPLKSDKVDD